MDALSCQDEEISSIFLPCNPVFPIIHSVSIRFEQGSRIGMQVHGGEDPALINSLITQYINISSSVTKGL